MTKPSATDSRRKGANHNPFHGVLSHQRVQSGSQHREGGMSKSASPKWLLSPEWGVGTDPCNWILYRRGSNRWNAVGFYPSPESLLKSLYNKLTRTEPADPDMVRHIEAISTRVQGWAAALSEQLDQWGLEGQKEASASEGVVSDQRLARKRNALRN